MRLRIHHGATQIGGNCVELECEGKALLLDLGLPLDAPAIMPDVPGLLSDDDRFLGVVLSHPHLDHYGLLSQARPGLPVWIGEGAKRLLEAAAPFTAGSALPQALNSYRTNEPFMIGPFRVTPFLMDHSAYDAHALLVEAGGRRLFYSGDFRGHGRKARTFERFLADPPADVDLMVMEGTTLGRQGEPVTEQDVEREALALMRATAGITLAYFSGQNIDRFVTFLRASIQAGRSFVIDAYMANLITALALPPLPSPESASSLRVFLPAAQKRMIVRNGRFDLIDRYAARRIYRDELARGPERYTMMVRRSMIADLADLPLEGASLIYSLWPGYLDRDRHDLRAWASDRGVAFHIVHSSGHAHRDDLERMAASVAPRRLMPIHTEHPDSFTSLYPHVQQAANGEWVEV